MHSALEIPLWFFGTLRWFRLTLLHREGAQKDVSETMLDRNGVM
jgi:hypothetical protein